MSFSAKIEYTSVLDFEKRLNRLDEKGTEIAKKMLYKGAGIVTDAVRNALHGAIKHTDKSTGDLSASLGIAKFNEQHCYADTIIGFDGYDSKGVPNQLKARCIESGTSKQDAHPFMRPAVNESVPRSVEAMARIQKEEIEKILD